MRIDSPNLVGSTVITGSAVVTGSIVPGLDLLYDFGSSLKRWGNVYAISLSGSFTGSNVTTGQVIVAGTGGVLSGTNNFFWDNTNSRIHLGSTIPLSGQKLNVYESGNSRTGLGVVSGIARSYTASDAAYTIGHVSVSDGSTYTERFRIDTSGNVGIGTTIASDRLTVNGNAVVTGSILPGQDVTFDLGAPTRRWRHMYTGDLHLKNERGDWTIIEEEDCLTMRNNKTGKRYKISMTPMPELDEPMGSFSTGPKPTQ